MEAALLSGSGGRVWVLGCAIDAVTLDQAVAVVDEAVASRIGIQHVAINAAKVVKLQRDAQLQEAVHGCELVTADGQAVVWAAGLLGQPLPERVTGIDLMEAVMSRAPERGYRIYLLGAEADVLETAATRIRDLHPGIDLVGCRDGFFVDDEEAEVAAHIRAARPDVLFVALTTPKKELFLARWRETLDVPFVMGVGGAFDVMAGLRRRAPRIMQRLGLEWAYRLIQDPRHLLRRYAVGNTIFSWLVARAALRRALGRRPLGLAPPGQHP
jgi:N-acetylglucosaminyldiphosphoundecaprenol N-acetyl-beta-D-mannosaminyltransferase